LELYKFRKNSGKPNDTKSLTVVAKKRKKVIVEIERKGRK
jgi:hypothetical protein